MEVRVVVDSAPAGGNAAAQDTNFVRITLRIHHCQGDISKDGILGESRAPHEMEQLLTCLGNFQSTRAIRHKSFALSSSNPGTQVSLVALAVDAVPFLALRGVAGHDEVTGFVFGDTGADGLDDSGSLVAQD